MGKDFFDNDALVDSQILSSNYKECLLVEQELWVWRWLLTSIKIVLSSLRFNCLLMSQNMRLSFCWQCTMRSKGKVFQNIPWDSLGLGNGTCFDGN